MRTYRSEISAEPWFSAEAVQKICHDAETGKREGDRCQSDKAGKEEPLGAVEPREHGAERKVDAYEDINITFEEPPVCLHEIEPAVLLSSGDCRAWYHRTCAEEHEDVPHNAEAGERHHDGAESHKKN